jgi:Fe-S-cluster-containing hydrogenase component 2
MTGAPLVQVGSVLMLKGIKYLPSMISGLEEFMDKHGYPDIASMTGIASQRSVKDYGDQFKKPRMHSEVTVDACKNPSCTICIQTCFYDALAQGAGKVDTIHANCIGCEMCTQTCPFGATGMHTTTDAERASRETFFQYRPTRVLEDRQVRQGLRPRHQACPGQGLSTAAPQTAAGRGATTASPSTSAAPSPTWCCWAATARCSPPRCSATRTTWSRPEDPRRPGAPARAASASPFGQVSEVVAGATTAVTNLVIPAQGRASPRLIATAGFRDALVDRPPSCRYDLYDAAAPELADAAGSRASCACGGRPSASTPPATVVQALAEARRRARPSRQNSRRLPARSAHRGLPPAQLSPTPTNERAHRRRGRARGSTRPVPVSPSSATWLPQLREYRARRPPPRINAYAAMPMLRGFTCVRHRGRPVRRDEQSAPRCR